MGMHRLLVSCSLVVMAACPPSTLKPTITVTSNPNTLTISGAGFAAIAQCAQLSIIGLPAPSNHVSIGQPQCSSGGFQNYNWAYQYVTGCQLSTSPQNVSATVFGVDTQGTNASASAQVSIPWGVNCALVGTCGQIGLPICPDGTCSAGVPGNDGTCDACGTEGAPICAGTTPCTGDLHPNFQNREVECTWNCGHAQGASCPSALPGCGGAPLTLEQPQNACEVPLQPPDLTNGGIYSCYDHAMIPSSGGDCTCVPNNANTCPTSTSIPKPPAPNQGVCVQGQFKDLNGNGC